MKYEATHLRGRLYAVRPEGQLGTCGWSPKAWAVMYVNANSPIHALLKASMMQVKLLMPQRDTCSAPPHSKDATE